jgi:hypothetical protein
MKGTKMQYTIAFLALGCICNMIGCSEDKAVNAFEAEVTEFVYVKSTVGSTGCDHHHYHLQTKEFTAVVGQYEVPVTELKIYVNEHHHPELLEKIREAEPGTYQVNYKSTDYGNEIVSFYAKD